MYEIAGLQIDWSCFLCGASPSVTNLLFEMQNHLYICAPCLSKEWEKGKHIKGVNGSEIDPTTLGLQLPNTVESGLSTPLPVFSSSTSNNDIFSILALPPDSSLAQVLEVITNKMRNLLRQPRSEEREQKRERLQAWQEDLTLDPTLLEQWRGKQKTRSLPTSKKNTLLVGGHTIETLEEFVSACEQSEDAWHDGEIYLRSSDLEYWVLPVTRNIPLAQVIHIASTTIPDDFHALNYTLYRLLPTRPFRLYSQKQWQPASLDLSASTHEALAEMCDTHWKIAKWHLYYGDMLSWLEHSHEWYGIQKWFKETIANYPSQRSEYQSLGLELLLEQIMPTLTKPKLLVSIDGNEGAYTLSQWDSEIPHPPVTITIKNVTRGPVIITTELISPSDEPGWIKLENPLPSQLRTTTLSLIDPNTDTPANLLSPLYIRPGEHDLHMLKLSFQDLPMQKWDKTYQCTLRIVRQLTSQQEPIQSEYPIILHTMRYQQGFRKHLWHWGLRGGFPGLFWNAIVGAIGACILLLFITTFQYTPSAESRFFPGLILFATITGIKYVLISFLNLGFIPIAAGIASLPGCIIGFGKGHTNYPLGQNSKNFITISFWSSVALLVILLSLTWDKRIEGADDVFSHIMLSIGNLFVSFSIVFLICLVSLVRILAEVLLRRHYKELLRPERS